MARPDPRVWVYPYEGGACVEGEGEAMAPSPPSAPARFVGASTPLLSSWAAGTSAKGGVGVEESLRAAAQRVANVLFCFGWAAAFGQPPPLHPRRDSPPFSIRRLSSRRS